MTNEIRIILTFLVAFFSALFVMPNMSHIANRIGLVDHPNERKIHRVPKPLVGGIGIVISATFSSLLFVPIEGLRGFFAGLAVLLLVGFFDDFLEIGHRKKFLAQIIATSLLMFLSNVHLTDFGNLLGFGDIVVPGVGWLVWIVTVFCVVGVTNALNMIDGLDGLAGGVSFVAFVSFAVLSSCIGDSSLVLLNLAIAGAVLGFLRYNWSPAILFMGDAGSLCLGFALSFMAISLTQSGDANIPPVIVLLVLAVPIADTLTVMIKRIVAGKSPFMPDKTHLHHTLILAGYDGKKSVGMIVLLCLIFSVIGVLGFLYRFPEPLLFALFSGYFMLNFFSARLVRAGTDLSEMFKRREKPQKCPPALYSLVQNLNRSRFFRGATRYSVNIAVTCSSYSCEEVLPGHILNISKTGFLAHIDGLGLICEECLVSIVPSDNIEIQLIEFGVEHLWMSKEGDRQLHGFRFLELDLGQRQKLHDFLEFLQNNEE